MSDHDVTDAKSHIGGLEGALIPSKQENAAHIDKMNAARDDWELVYESVLNPHTGDAFLVKAGQVISQVAMFDRPQCCDWLFVTPDLKRVSSMGNTVPFNGYWMKKYTRINSAQSSGDGVGMSPMVTMSRDDTENYPN